MKKYAPLLLLFLFIMVAWEAMVGPSGVSVNVDGDELGGPVGALVGVLFAGGGLLIAGIVMLFVGVLLALLFAGLGVLAVGGLALGALVLALMVSPLLLPLAIPLAIVWYLASRARKQRAGHEAVKPL
ncbi:hypothetical protein [Massilia antarctica]|uniref:hypothetical protein n=1 Tax=Massilia antarctica TaxID=2765360 RepID=UPI0006BB8FFB|nr:hypothetical protein [Massilia sp. H27-R4]MCY0915107.1 hypothetical protein [Massilia sp. H27-R4]CUI07086.1 hypothetical protein BN2497_8949 [Janthinobacterium sp. CG23_2]CUU30872.1 hypothetical protein BN3177_8949 [Janthinobacterium sp. CG23_2]